MDFVGKNKLSNEEIEQIAQEYRRGSAEAFHLLYTFYSPKIYRFCLRMLADKARAEDAFQEVFIKVFENRKNIRTNNFGAWIFKVARHICINHLRSQKPQNDYDSNSLALSYVYQDDFEMRDWVKRAIAHLPISLREALILREYEEYSYDEIAEILGISVSLAKVRVHRARLLLKKLLEPIAKEYYENR